MVIHHNRRRESWIVTRLSYLRIQRFVVAGPCQKRVPAPIYVLCTLYIQHSQLEQVQQLYFRQPVQSPCRNINNNNKRLAIFAKSNSEITQLGTFFYKKKKLMIYSEYGKAMWERPCPSLASLNNRLPLTPQFPHTSTHTYIYDIHVREGKLSILLKIHASILTSAIADFHVSPLSCELLAGSGSLFLADLPNVIEYELTFFFHV